MVEITGFAVGEEIGRGGFGVVYRARDTSFDRDVAVKVLRDVPGTDLRARFLSECRAVGSLGGSPGIPTVYSTGVTAEGAPFMAMELLPGGSLAERQPLPPDVVVAVGRRLAEALQAAHDGGVIHRDVKPANVLFDHDDQPVLVDFGISSLVGEPGDSGSENVAVSVAFAPPEMLAGGRPEVPGDIYALGATLFCALTGRAPFVSTYGYESISTIAARIATAQVEDLRPLGVPDGLARTIEIAMAKDPAARFATMSAFGAALAAVAQGRSVPVAPAGGAASVGAGSTRVAGSRRPRRAVLVAATVSAVLLAGGVTALAMTTGDAPDSTPVAATGAPSGAPGSSSGESSVAGAADQRPATTGVPGDNRQSVGIVGADGSTAGVPIGSTARPRTAASTAPSKAGGGHGGKSTHTSTTVVPSTRPPSTHPTSAGPTSPAPTPVNHHPAVSATGKTWSERATVSVPITASDPDGDRVTLSVSGLPSWLQLKGTKVSGVAPYNAATVTTTRTAIKTRTFTLTITATDTHQAKTKKTVAVRIRDTLRTMPNYYGKTGKGTPSTAAVSTATRGACAYQKKGDGTTIFWQSVRPGTVIPWGKKVTYRFGSSKTSCAHLSSHWPS